MMFGDEHEGDKPMEKTLGDAAKGPAPDQRLMAAVQAAIKDQVRKATEKAIIQGTHDLEHSLEEIVASISLKMFKHISMETRGEILTINVNMNGKI